PPAWRMDRIGAGAVRDGHRASGLGAALARRDDPARRDRAVLRRYLESGVGAVALGERPIDARPPMPISPPHLAEERSMAWEKPEMIEIEMNAEIGAYQPD